MIDRRSETWEAVAQAVERERGDALARLTRPGLDPITTEFLRGRISALDAIASLGDRKPG